MDSGENARILGEKAVFVRKSRIGGRDLRLAGRKGCGSLTRNNEGDVYRLKECSLVSENEITSVRSGDSAAPEPTPSHAALAAGARVGNFHIVRVLGVGGFGVVYLAEQEVTGRQVAIKEFFPASMVDRAGSHAVRLRAEKDEELFSQGMRCFVKEAMLLSELSHPGLVQVLHFWEENGTAYMVMPFYEGVPLSRMLAKVQAGDIPRLADLLLKGLLPALEYLHERHIYHRDISPDNIFMLAGGKPMLLDFGAARRIVDRQENVTVILKSGYAPIEQYDESGLQGAWTDIYALSALLYKLITGHAPQAAAARVCGDTVERLTSAYAGRFPHSLLRAIDAGLAVRPEDRPRSVAAWRQILDTPDDETPPEPEGPVVTYRPPHENHKRRTWLAALLLVVVAMAAWVWYQPENRQRLAGMEARHLYSELDKILPTLEKSVRESEGRITYYREKIRLAKDPAVLAGLRDSLYVAEENGEAARRSLDVYAVKLKKELPVARKRLAMAESARVSDRTDEAEMLFQSALQHLRGLKEWSDGEVKAHAARRASLVQGLNGVWSDAGCETAATWILNGDVLHITRPGEPSRTQRVVAAYDGRVITTPVVAKGEPLPDLFTEYQLQDNTLRLRQGKLKQVLRACEG